MKEAYLPQKLPDAYGNLDYSYFFEELIDANSARDVYMSKLEDSKVNSTWFLPILQANEAVNSLSLEGTQTKLDDVLVDQIDGNDTDKNNNEVTATFGNNRQSANITSSATSIRIARKYY